MNNTIPSIGDPSYYEYKQKVILEQELKKLRQQKEEMEKFKEEIHEMEVAKIQLELQIRQLEKQKTEILQLKYGENSDQIDLSNELKRAKEELHSLEKTRDDLIFKFSTFSQKQQIILSSVVDA